MFADESKLSLLMDSYAREKASAIQHRENNNKKQKYETSAIFR